MKKVIEKKELTLKEMQSLGGKARARKYSKEQLQAWARLGGRPKKVIHNSEKQNLQE